MEEGQIFNGTIRILQKIRIAPQILLATDGEDSFDVLNLNAEPEDVVDVKGKFMRRYGRIQLNVTWSQKSGVDFEKIIKEKSRAKDVQLLSPELEVLKDKMQKIASRIKKAEINKEDVMIRYHGDADGICSAMAIAGTLSKATLNISRTPYYDVQDALKDIAFSLKYRNRKPVMIVVDNGSTTEDEAGLSILHSAGVEIIVIDHHQPHILEGKSSVCKYTSFHLNPRMYGLSGEVTAGILCYEIARMTGKEPNAMLPAVSAVADKSTGEIAQKYINHSSKTKEELQRYGQAIDYMLTMIPFDMGTNLFNELLSNIEFYKSIDIQTQRLIESEIQKMKRVEKVQDEGISIYEYEISWRTRYPGPGKLTGVMHEINQKTHKKVVTLGILNEIIVIRQSHPFVPVVDLVDMINTRMPDAGITGGGHECAGSIKFPTDKKEIVIKTIKQILRDAKDNV